MTCHQIKYWSTVAVGLFAPAIFTGIAHAIPLGWGAPQQITGDSDVSTTGTLVYAYNTGGTANTDGAANPITPGVAPADETVPSSGGVDFIAFNCSNNTGGVASNSNVSISGVDPNYGGGGAYFGSGNTPFSSLSANYQALLTQGVFGSSAGESPSGNVPLVLTLGGLTNGRTYLFEVWANDSRGTNRSETVSDGINTSSPLILDNGGANGGVGDFIIETFVASGSTQQITFTGNAATGDSQINAFQLRLVPEPATLSLAGLGTIGGLMARRRR